MTAPHSNPNPTLRHQIRNWFLPTLSALTVPASKAGLRAQYPAVAPGENGATPGTRAGEIELARNQTAAYPEPVVQDRAEHDLQKTQDDRIAERRLDGVPSLGLRLGGMIVGSCRTLGPEYDMPLLSNRDTHGDPHLGGDYLVEFSTFIDAGAVPVFYSIAVLDLRIVKWATKGYWSGQRLVVTQNVWRER